MATNRQGGGASLLFSAALVLALAATAQAQGFFPGFPNYVLGQCPGYQSTPDFTQDVIDQLSTGTTDGYVLVLTSGSADSCQKLKFLDDETFKFSYSDVANRPRVYSSTYSASLANFTHSAQIRLTLVTGILGSDIFGRLTLIPLVYNTDKLVLASCQQVGALKSEQLLVFVPYPSTADVTALKEELVTANIPNADTLAEISQECTPGVSRSPLPLPLRFYNLLATLNNPGRRVQNAASSIGERSSFRTGLVVDDGGNVYPQPATNTIPFTSANFEAPMYYQQPFISSFSYGYPASVPSASFVPYVSPYPGAPSRNHPGQLSNDIYSQFYDQAY